MTTNIFNNNYLSSSRNLDRERIPVASKKSYLHRKVNKHRHLSRLEQKVQRYLQESLKEIGTKHKRSRSSSTGGYKQMKRLRKEAGFVQSALGTVLKIISKAKGNDVALSNTASGIGIPLTVIDIPLSVLGMKMAYRTTKRSWKLNDQEGIRDGSISGLFMGTSLVSSIVDLFAAGFEVGGSPAAAAAITPAAQALGVVVFSFSIIMDSMRLRRSKRMLDEMKNVEKAHIHDPEHRQAIAYVKYLRSKLEVSKTEIREICKKHKSPQQIRQEIYKLRKTKERRLKRRVGEKLLAEFKTTLPRLSIDLQLKKGYALKRAILCSKSLFQRTKNKLAKNMSIAAVGIAAAAIGLIAILTLKSAVIFPYVLFGLSLALFITQFIIEGKVSADKFSTFTQVSGKGSEEFSKIVGRAGKPSQTPLQALEDIKRLMRLLGLDHSKDQLVEPKSLQYFWNSLNVILKSIEKANAEGKKRNRKQEDLAQVRKKLGSIQQSGNVTRGDLEKIVRKVILPRFCSRGRGYEYLTEPTN